MKMNLKRGFTLIELLVVIAIIGILASVVLASLTSARKKGQDAAVFSALSSSRAQAELYYATNGNYGKNSGAAGAALGATGGASVLPTTTTTACDTTNTNASTNTTMFGTAASSSGLDGLIKGMCNSGATSITAALDALASSTVNATAWAMKAQGASATAFYCVDSTGAAKSYSSAPSIAAGATCP